MTLGVAAYGAGAGGAVLSAWAAAETAGSGAIGGFVVFTVLTAAGPISIECQRGGLIALHAQGIPDEMIHAPVAALITSGPDRPQPLTQFLAAGNSALVTGHRLPNLKGANGIPVNIAALRRIERCTAPQDAVTQVCADNPTLDAGLIAVTRDGIGLAETAEVHKRGDRGQTLIYGSGRALALLHNSIDPIAGFADLVARAGMSAFN